MYPQLKTLQYGEGEEYELRADAAPLYNVDEPREAQIVDWRVRCFERAGFTPLDAGALAVRRDVDRADAEALLAAGATPEQATRILL